MSNGKITEMYNNNIHRKLDARGRLVIPKHIRNVFRLEDGTVEIFTENDLIILRKVTVHADEISKPRPSARGTSGCNYCICSSCTGFGCPWVSKVYRYGWTIGESIPERCRRCMTTPGMEKIHDCDFYTAKKRTKFYYKRIVKAESKHDILMRELSELKSLLTNR
jgi:AbrB family looped-hinge helix DNA binding protein